MRLANFLANKPRYDYKVLPIFLSKASFKYVDNRNTNTQGAELFVEQVGDEYEIIDDHSIALSNFCDELKSYLVGFTKSNGLERKIAYGWKANGSGAEAADAKPGRRADKIPFRVNRQSQCRSIRSAFSDIRNSIAKDEASLDLQQHPVVICHGRESDVSRQFTKTTLVSRVIGEYKDLFKSSKETENEILPFPDWVNHSFKGQEKFDEEFCEDLAGKFQVSQRGGRRASLKESVAGAFHQNKITRLVVSRMNLSHSDVATKKFSDLRQKIDAWVGFWSTFPFELSVQKSHFTILPVLDIVYPDAVSRSRNFFGGKPTPEKFVKLLSSESSEQELTPPGGKVSVHVLDKFQSIKESMVDTWIDEDGELFQQFVDSKKDQLREDLKTLVATPDGLPMRDWAKGSEDILRDAGVGL